MAWAEIANIMGPEGPQGDPGSDADVTAHEAAPDPHPQYLTETAAGVLYKPQLATAYYSKVLLTADVSNSLAGSGNSLTANLDLDYPAGAAFTFEFVLFMSTASTAATPEVFVFPVGTNEFTSYRVASETVNTGTSRIGQSATTPNTVLSGNDSYAVGGPWPMYIRGSAVNGGAANQLGILFRSSAAGTAVTVHSGSWGQLDLF